MDAHGAGVGVNVKERSRRKGRKGRSAGSFTRTVGIVLEVE